jgi:ABC-type thiamine transport system ATPase subunit
MEYAAEIAEYLALASSLRKGEGQVAYRRANQLSMYLAMELPAKDYKAIVQATIAPKKAMLELVAAFRKREDLGLGELTGMDIAVHDPSIGIT